MNYKKRLFLLLLLIFSNLFLFVSKSKASDELAAIENLYSSISVDLPEADVVCRAGGSLGKIFSKSIKVKTGGNVFFLDKENKEIAQFERAEAVDSQGRESSINILIKISDVPRTAFEDLVLKKKMVVTDNAKIIFVIKSKNPDNTEDIYIYDGKDIEGNDAHSVIYTKMDRISVKKFNENKFFVADGNIKIRFSMPPKKILSEGGFEDVFGNETASLSCYCNDCPIHDYDLSDLEDAFDGQLTEEIIQEASNNTTP